MRRQGSSSLAWGNSSGKHCPATPQETIMGLTNDPINGLSLFTFPVKQSSPRHTRHKLKKCNVDLRTQFSFTFLKIKCHEMLFFFLQTSHLQPASMSAWVHVLYSREGHWEIERDSLVAETDHYRLHWNKFTYQKNKNEYMAISYWKDVWPKHVGCIFLIRSNMIQLHIKAFHSFEENLWLFSFMVLCQYLPIFDPRSIFPQPLMPSFC